ncbi:Kap122p ASCRUDRAFT_75766 [Ascoidea rubescens DSM 1968]|uniref:Uncharacterized protein n=1 Tax=Ascoidea rubescens DSM 1968 TaxID=1344418 RepID=A0A1D2VHB8_9ASCO|nr:hypothetical protein ASCRUDRAFT_75766 [Ascoidea rubescens DSM 1968]ODV61026.1 hypothetical protein ASCRUDRAFT_75766 [Ascoidea rubescens DSM 1968]
MDTSAVDDFDRLSTLDQINSLNSIHPFLPHISNLINKLYTPNSLSNFDLINCQKKLQLFQKSLFSLTIANYLLDIPNDLNSNFFGALTFTVYLNHLFSNQFDIAKNNKIIINIPETDNDDDEDIDNNSIDYNLLNQITSQLLNHLIRLINNNLLKNTNNNFIIKKIYSNLSLIYINSTNINIKNSDSLFWKNPILSLLLLLSSNKINLNINDNNLIPNFLNTISTNTNTDDSYNYDYLYHLLNFSNILIEDISKFNVSIYSYDFNSHIYNNFFQSNIYLLSFIFNNNIKNINNNNNNNNNNNINNYQIINKIITESVTTFQSWLNYISLLKSSSLQLYKQHNKTINADTNSIIDLLILLLSFLSNFNTFPLINKNLETIQLIIQLYTNLFEVNNFIVSNKSSFNDHFFLLLFHQNQWGSIYINYLLRNSLNQKITADSTANSTTTNINNNNNNNFTDDNDLDSEFDDDNDEDHLLLVSSFANLIISYLEIDIIKFASLLLQDSNDYIFQFLINLTDLNGVPIINELISRDFIEFWSNLSEVLIDNSDLLLTLLNNNADDLIKIKKKLVLLLSNISQIYWNKILLPLNDSNLLLKIINYNKDEFDSYRNDVADFFETIYPLIGAPLYKNLINNILTNIDDTKTSSIQNIMQLEASLYLLISINTSFSEDNFNLELLNLISSIFNTNFLDLVLGSNNYYLISTTVRFLSSIEIFYKHNIGLDYLESILYFLFRCLSLNANTISLSDSNENSNHLSKSDLVLNWSNSLQFSVSKSISRICDECRYSLTKFLPKFDKILFIVINNLDIHNFIREKIINSISSIIQSINDPQLQCNHLLNLIDSIHLKSTNILNSVENGTLILDEQIMNYLVSLLKCVLEIGKGMQFPDEIEDSFFSAQEELKYTEYWSNDSLVIKSKILDIISNYSVNPKHQMIFLNYNNPNNSEKTNSFNDVIDNCCSIFRAGLPEKLPGPFVFDDNILLEFVVAQFDNIVQFITKDRRLSISLIYLFDLLRSVLNTNYKRLSVDQVNLTLNKIFFNYIDTLIKSDIDFVESSLQMILVIIEKKPSLLINPDNISNFNLLLNFNLNNLMRNEKQTLKFTSKFWILLIQLKNGDRECHDYVKKLFIENKVGNQLMLVTLQNMIKSDRSNIPVYGEIIRALFGKFQLYFKTWITSSFEAINQEAQFHNSSEINQANSDLKIIYNTQTVNLLIQKLLVCKGSKKVITVLKEFWLSSNNLYDY